MVVFDCQFVLEFLDAVISHFKDFFYHERHSFRISEQYYIRCVKGWPGFFHTEATQVTRLVYQALAVAIVFLLDDIVGAALDDAGG